MVAGQQGLSCVAVGGQQYIALGGNQMVQVASGVSEGGVADHGSALFAREFLRL